MEWLIEGILPRKALYFIGGVPGVGKTLLVLQMAGCLMTAQPFLGRKTIPSRVLLVERNEGQELIKDKIKKQSVKFPTLWDLEIYWGDMRLDADKDKLSRLASYKKPDVLFLDTFSDIHNKDENSASEMGQIMDILRNTVTKHSVTVVCLHHFSRSYATRGQPAQAGHLRGSTAIEGECDFVGMNKRGKELFLEKLKFRSEFEPIKLDFDSKTLTFSVSGKQTKGTKKHKE